MPDNNTGGLSNIDLQQSANALGNASPSQTSAVTTDLHGHNVNSGGLSNLTNQDVQNAFINPSNGQIQQAIANGPINQQANQVAPSPLAGLTALGTPAYAGATNINTGTSNALLGGQIANINQLNAQAHGQGPSLASMAAQQVGQQNIAGQMAMLGSQRGASNSALGLREAMNAKAQTDQQVAQASAQGRAAEELNAQQQLTAALGGTQGQAMQGAQAQAQLGQATNLANAGSANQSQLQQGSMNQQTQLANAQQQAQQTLANLQAKQQTQGLNAQEYNDMLQAQMTLSSNNQTAAENYINAMIGQNLSQQDIDKGLAINSTNNQMGLIGAGIAGGAALGAGALAASDRNLKTNIKSGTRSVKGFLDQINQSNKPSGFSLWSNE